MKLWEYEGKKVRVTCISGRIFEGYVDYYTSELDDPDGVASLSLDSDGADDDLVNFAVDEIMNIETIPVSSSKVPFIKTTQTAM